MGEYGNEVADTLAKEAAFGIAAEQIHIPWPHSHLKSALRLKAIIYPNSANADVVVSGYDIPKGSVVVSNLWEVHNDPEYWKDPEKFLPERFLVEEDGKLTTIKPDGFIPFSIGRRNCPGEQVAMIEILHYFVTIMQNFQLLPEFDGKLPDLSGNLGITYQCKPQKLRFVPRD
ncbi:cytochrome P450 2U1-like [Stegodyphus dumicola]|uniref:cytochrome P450 2U1-like n=1 Tax=Stegodyphus dumicola TaxID=202533 RepID=UPI0015AAF4EF|nr:cytochrome P450 2U1-like [Stegodyphus dumicola]